MMSLNLLKSLGQSLACRRMFSAGSRSVLGLAERRSSVPCMHNSRWLLSENNQLGLSPFSQTLFLHTSANCSAWESKNKTVYPPQKPGEPRRPAEVYYSRRDIKHSQRKMWYITTFIKGLMIDDALAQLEFVNRKAAKIAREVLLEAQEEAVKNHNVEFKSNLHIAEALVGKGTYQHAIRYHAKGRASVLDLVYCHLLIKLKEGPPPEKPTVSGYDQAKHYLESKRRRTIVHGL